MNSARTTTTGSRTATRVDRVVHRADRVGQVARVEAADSSPADRVGPGFAIVTALGRIGPVVGLGIGFALGPAGRRIAPSADPDCQTGTLGPLLAGPRSRPCRVVALDLGPDPPVAPGRSGGRVLGRRCRSFDRRGRPLALGRRGTDRRSLDRKDHLGRSCHCRLRRSCLGRHGCRSRPGHGKDHKCRKRHRRYCSRGRGVSSPDRCGARAYAAQIGKH